MYPKTVMSGVAIREMFFLVRSGHDSKFPAEISLYSDDSSGEPRESCREHSRSMKVNCLRFSLRSLLASTVGVSYVCCTRS